MTILCVKSRRLWMRLGIAPASARGTAVFDRQAWRFSERPWTHCAGVALSQADDPSGNTTARRAPLTTYGTAGPTNTSGRFVIGHEHRPSLAANCPQCDHAFPLRRIESGEGRPHRANAVGQLQRSMQTDSTNRWNEIAAVEAATASC